MEVYLISSNYRPGGIYEWSGEDAQSAVAGYLESIEFVEKSIVVEGHSRRKEASELWKPFRCEVKKGP